MCASSRLLLLILRLSLRLVAQAHKCKLGVQEANLRKISNWPELQDSVVAMRGIGQTDFCSSAVLVLQPFGHLIPFDIEHGALLRLIEQFSHIVQKLSKRGYLHGDLSYYNLLAQQGSEDQGRDGQDVHALLVDMQTLMSLSEVLCSFLRILLPSTSSPLSVSYASWLCCCAGCSCRVYNWYTIVHGLECHA